MDTGPLDKQLPPDDTGRPPFFRTWPGMYRFLIVLLVLQIACFYLLTLMYNV
jgi:hypothetical protein